MITRATGYLRQATDAFHIFQARPIKFIHFGSALHNVAHMLQLQQAKGSVNFTHLAINSRGYHCGLVNKAKVLEVVDALLGFSIRAHNGTPFKGVKHLGGMKADARQIAMAQHAAACIFHAKRMTSVVDHAQVVVVGNFLNGSHIARIAIAVHGQDGSGLRGNGGFDLGGVQVQCFGLNVHKHRFIAMPEQRMSGSDKAIRGGDDFACDAQGLQRCN